MTNIIKAEYAQINIIKEFMLLALKEDPLAFSVEYLEYSLNSDEWWKSYLSKYFNNNGVLYLAKENNKIIGTAGVIFNLQQRHKHVCSIVWVYVLKEYRGQKLSSKLLHILIDFIKTQLNIKKVSLIVNSKQIAAINLYKKFGFIEVGRLKDELIISGNYVDQIIMELFL